MLNTPHISFVPFPVSVPIHQLGVPKSTSKISVCFGGSLPKTGSHKTKGAPDDNIRTFGWKYQEHFWSSTAAIHSFIHSFKNMWCALAMCHEWLRNGYEAPHHRRGPGRCRQTSWWGSSTKTLWIRLGFWSRAVWHPLQPIDAAFCDSSVPPWCFSRC